MIPTRFNAPGWDSRMICRAVLLADEVMEDTSAWSDEHVFDFLQGNHIGVTEERIGLWTYTLHIWQGERQIADLQENY